MNAKKSQKLKLAAIPALAIVLFYVLPGSEGTKSETTISLRQPPSDQQLKNPTIANKTLAEIEKTAWPVFSASDFADLNPFDKSMIFPHLVSQKPQRDEAADTDLLVSNEITEPVLHRSTVKIQAIFQSNKGVAAMVGTKIVHVGDRLDDGMEVVAITSEHLIVAVPGVD